MCVVVPPDSTVIAAPIEAAGTPASTIAYLEQSVIVKALGLELAELAIEKDEAFGTASCHGGKQPNTIDCPVHTTRKSISFIIEKNRTMWHGIPSGKRATARTNRQSADLQWTYQIKRQMHGEETMNHGG